jgi:stress response protein SCP2
MTTTSGPPKGKTQTVALPADGHGRLMVGLSWAPKEEGPKVDYSIPPLKDAEGQYDTLYFFKLPWFVLRAVALWLFSLVAPVLYRHGLATVKGAKSRTPDPHDLDLFCYVADRNFGVIHAIGPKDAALIDPTRKVYHSGEDATGRNPADAEQIFVELRGISLEYDQLFFVVKSANRNTLADIPEGSIRLVDSASNEVLLQNVVSARALPPGNSFGYVFCSLSREFSGGWSFRNIDSFVGREVDWNLLVQALVLQQGLA